MSEDQISQAIDKAAEAAKVDRTTFLQAFQELYACNPFQYAENERDDASDACFNPRNIDPDFFDNGVSIDDLRDEGIDVATEDGDL